MKKLLLLVALLVLIPSILGQSECLAYFTGEGCHECAEMDRFTAYLNFKYPAFVPAHYEVYRNDANVELLKGYFSKYEVPAEKQGLPALFIGNMYFVGNHSTLPFVENEVVKYLDGNCSSYNMSSFLGFTGTVSPIVVTETVGLIDLAPAALGDSLTAGLLVLLTLFIVLCAAVRSKEKMIVKGVLFLIGAIIINVLFVLGSFSSVHLSTLYYFTKAVGVIMVLTGVAVLTHVARYPKPLLGAKQDAATKHARLLISYLGFFILGLLGGYLSLGPRSVEVATLQFLSTVRDMQSVLVVQAIWYAIIAVWLFIAALVALYNIKSFLEKHSVVRSKERRDDVDRWIKHHHRFLNAVVAGLALVVGVLFLVI